jgi:molybdenum cofactor cytidylyltransferase
VTVTGLVLAAGSSSRLGQPKQLLPYRGGTLLDATIAMARRCPFDQLLVTTGVAADAVVARADLRGAAVVHNPQPTTGCSSSIVTALARVDPAAEGLVLLLGDQPGVAVATVEALRRAGPDHPVAVIRYDDGIGHPFWFRRDTFDDLAGLQGDKAVWKLLESGRHPVHEVRAAGPVPLDVDTWDDYHALLAQGSPATAGRAR